jgi:hypothetical protein
MKNIKSNGAPRLGRPPGPTANRGYRPWDHFDLNALYYIAANPDLPRYQIAEALGISLSRLSTISCSPTGVTYLERLKQLDPAKLARFILK